MRRHILRQLQMTFGIIGLLALVGIVVIVWRTMSSPTAPPEHLGPRSTATPAAPSVALISGHAGFDSGAVCTDDAGQVVVKEAEVNAAVTREVVRLLSTQGVTTLVLDEYDPRLEGLAAGVLLSLHADSCIEVSGYKAAARLNSAVAERESKLVACIDQHYAAVTGLVRHPDTITPNMTEYHAYRRIASTTPAAVLEMGFLGGDYLFLTQQPEVIAQGIAESLFCFLRPPATPLPEAE
jgi:N-acetylmuramoyl-L-alanine amidase